MNEHQKGKERILTRRNRGVLYAKLTDYLREVLDDEEDYSTLEDLYQEACRAKARGGIRRITPALIAEWLEGLPVGTEFSTCRICVMILDFLGLDEGGAGKLGDDDSIYVESRSDIDGFYWRALGDIVYRQHFESLYKAGKPAEVQL